MNPSLAKLLMLSYKAGLRRMIRGAKTLRGALLLMVSLGFLVLILAPSVLVATSQFGQVEAPPHVDLIESLAPLGLCMLAAMFIFISAGEKAIHFTPAEVDLLFPAPLSRRELLVYKLAGTAPGLLVMSLFLSVLSRGSLRAWLHGFVGIALALGLLQLLAMSSAMLSQIVAEAAYSRARKVLL